MAVQKQLCDQINKTLEEVYNDMRMGLRETVGVNCSLIIAEKCSIKLDLPEDTDTIKIANAIDLENVEAWCDSAGGVNVAISPWYSTKDVDQSVLCIIKVIHVLLGLHAGADARQQSKMQRILSSISEIIQIQKRS